MCVYECLHFCDEEGRWIQRRVKTKGDKFIAERI